MKSLLLIVPFTLIVGVGWSQNLVPTGSFPPLTDGASFIHHPKSGAMLLIGGASVIPDSTGSQVWKWDGKRWSASKTQGPGTLDFFPGAMRRKEGKIYFFGGIGSDEKRKGDVWAFDGNQWMKVKTNTIGTRDHHAMVYADHLDAFVVYGGQNSTRDFDTTTWLLRDGKFTALQIPGPGKRFHSAMAYDNKRKKVVLYGGGFKPDEHWEFDGKKWAQIKTTVNPGKKLYHKMAYHDDLGMVILHGGWRNQDPRDSANHANPVTWGWDGTTWTAITQQRVFPMALGYDPLTKTILAYGSSGSPRATDLALWSLENGKWNKIRDYGKWNTVDYVKKWIDKNPDDVQALLKYADLMQWQTKQFDEAERAYKKIAATAPDRNDIWMDLSIVLLMQGKVDEAETYLAKLNSAGLINRYAYARLGGLLLMEKRYAESARYQEKALALAENANDYFKLACTYAMIDNKDKAFEALDKAVAKGYRDKSKFESNGDLARLRTDARWRAIIDRLQ